MKEERVQRRLAAILAADVVGYSRLIDLDEAGTLARVKERRRGILDPLLARHQGRIVKVMGDGVLIDFASAVNAVACAVELQQRMDAANEGLAADRHIRLRIGVNLGDVVVEGGDLYGDGVIIAVRLQGLAEPGGICISRGVQEQVRNKLAFTYEELGPCTVKNSAKPVRTWRVRWDDQAASDGQGISPGGALPGLSSHGQATSQGQATSDGQATSPAPQQSSAKLSIAVLPFTNMSGDPAQQYFSDGITEDIITELARFRQLQVMACASSVGYRGQDPDMIRVGRELGVHYLLEGSVRRLGDRLRITAQLIDAASGHHLWAERFDRNQSEIFNVQDELVRTIVGTLVGRVQADRAAQLRRKPPASLEAYECLLRGDALPIGNPADEAEARRLYEKAVELDPGYARAYAFLAISCWYAWRRDMSGSTAALDQAFELGQKAVALDESDYQCHQFLGYIFLQRRAYDLAEYHYRRALALNNNRSPVVASMGQFYTYMGQPAKSLDCFQEAKRLDPFFEPSWYWLRLGLAYFAAGNYDMAITQMSRAPNLSFWGEAYLAACCALTDRIEQARDHAGEALRLLPAMTASGFAAKEPYKSATDRQRLIDALRKAGLPD